MNLTRIESVIDVHKTQNATVTVVGAGANRVLLTNLVCAGVVNLRLFDFDRIAPENIPRQGFDANQVGMLKTEAHARDLRSINPDVNVQCISERFTELSHEQLQPLIGDSDLLILTTDSFECQAFGNAVALHFDIPAIFAGVYEGGGVGEIVVWHEEIDACLRCLVPNRYKRHEEAMQEGGSIDPPSTGVTKMETDLLDVAVSQLAIGMITRGADNRYGRMIAALGDRNFIQFKLTYDGTFKGRDMVREQLGVADTCETFFSWNTAVRRDPDRGNLPCPDCETYRGHSFALGLHGAPGTVRVKPRRDPEFSADQKDDPTDAK